MYHEERFFRKLTAPLLEFLKKTKVTAEELTLFRVLFGVFTAIVILEGIYLYTLITITAYQFVMLLDYVDGSLARHRKTFKKSWVYFDLVTHLILAVLFLVAVTVSYYFETYSVPFLILGLFSAILFLFNNVFNKQSDFDRRADAIKNPQNWKKPKFAQLISFLKLEKPFGLFFILMVLNLKATLIVIYFFSYLFSASYKFYSEFKKLKNEK